MPWSRDQLKEAENREIVVPWDKTYVGKMYRNSCTRDIPKVSIALGVRCWMNGCSNLQNTARSQESTMWDSGSAPPGIGTPLCIQRLPVKLL